MPEPRLRIVAISNLYPPHFVGGYELAAQETVDALRARGHAIRVLTSLYGVRAPSLKRGVARILWQGYYGRLPSTRWIALVLGALWNTVVIRAALHALKPDVVLIFNPSGLGAPVLDWLHRQPLPVVHDVSDLWLSEAYAQDAWFNGAVAIPHRARDRALKWALVRALSPLLPTAGAEIDLHRSFFRSAFLKRRLAAAGMRVGDGPVIYHGLAPDSEPNGMGDRRDGIAFSGRMAAEKGPHVLLEAMAFLKRSGRARGLRVTMIGGLGADEYGARLRRLARELEPEITVTFTGQVSRTRAQALLREHRLFVFPVLWDEPFSIAVLEAMRAGLAIAATATGGSAEILIDDENCLLTPKGDPHALAGALERLLGDEALLARLAQGSAKTITRFKLELVIDAIEAHLETVVRASRVEPRAQIDEGRA